ncbi:MAG: Gfo/Idh/MocA family oxidoreductase [Armatimonadetes bacterium]|nr:Gfo/Idh/MocA family oxidoreductase [Armatimonadota bacterium]
MGDRPPAFSRRDFLKISSAAAIATGVGLAPRRLKAATSPASPSETVRLGFIGFGGRAQQLFQDFSANSDARVTAVCDVYDKHREQAAATVGGNPAQYKDFRDLLEKSDVDAVVIATPPHWHPLISIAAMEAGKDVYCEKPMALYPDEAHAMAKVARKHGRVTQVGTQIHATDNFRRVVEIVRSGALGKISSVRVQVTTNEAPGNIRVPRGAPTPEGLNWDMWLGPLEKQPFNEPMFAVGHRYFRECVHSWINELGPHIMDLAVWAMDPGEPRSVMATGGRYSLTDDSTIPDTVDVLYEYSDFTMTFMHTMGNGYNFGFAAEPDKGRRLAVFFHGTNGTLAGDYSSNRLWLEGIQPEDFQPKIKAIPPSAGHQREFLDSVKTRKAPSCNFDYHLPLATALTLAHVSLFSGERVEWDAQKGRVRNRGKASDLSIARYRAPWKLTG